MTVTTAVSWFGTCLQIAGAAGLASRFLTPRAAYGMMLPGAVIWLGLAANGHDWALAAMQLTFATINTIGIVKWTRP